MAVKKDTLAKKINYRRIELLIPPHIAAAMDNYRASKRPIPVESDAIRWLLTEALIEEGYPPEQPT